MISGETATDLVDDAWTKNEFIPTVAKRGGAVIAARGSSSAASAANGIIDHMHDWVLGTADNDWVSMSVCSDGSYGIEEGLIYSFPVTCENGDYSIVQGLEVNDFIQQKMKESEAELIEERDTCSDLF